MHHNDADNFPLTLLSAFCAVVSLSDIQPYLTFAASVIAIVSGGISIYKKTRKK